MEGLDWPEVKVRDPLTALFPILFLGNLWCIRGCMQVPDKPIKFAAGIVLPISDREREWHCPRYLIFPRSEIATALWIYCDNGTETRVPLASGMRSPAQWIRAINRWDAAANKGRSHPYVMPTCPFCINRNKINPISTTLHALSEWMYTTFFECEVSVLTNWCSLLPGVLTSWVSRLQFSEEHTQSCWLLTCFVYSATLEHGGSTFLRSVCTIVKDCGALRPRK